MDDRAIIRTIIALHIWEEGFDGQPPGVTLAQVAAAVGRGSQGTAEVGDAWGQCLRIADALVPEAVNPGPGMRSETRGPSR